MTYYCMASSVWCRLAEEEDRLALAKSSMSPKDLQNVLETAKLLKAAQEREDPPEARATLPNLGLEDMEKTAKEIPSVHKQSATGGASLLLNNVQSSGILYTDIAFDFSGKSIVQFFDLIFTNM